MDCTSCEELRESAPTFVRKGLNDKMRKNLANNEGYEKHNDNCEDLNLANDCLIGRMPNALKSYDDCDWKAWARDFSDNVYQVMGSVIASMCGLWDKDWSILTAPAKLVYTRDKGATGQTLPYWTLTSGQSESLDIYMDAKEGSLYDLGSKSADRDYIVVATCCFDMQSAYENEYVATWYSSADTLPLGTIRSRKGQHPMLQNSDQNASNFSWPLTELVYVKKGAHLVLDTYCQSANPQGTAKVRVHQIALAWIPVNSVEVND